MRTRIIAATCLMAILSLTGLHALAQRPIMSKDSTWRFSGNASLTFNQVYLSNWVAGGQNSISGEANAFMQLEYMKGAASWVNTLELGYGLTQLGEDGLTKHMDKIDLASKYGYKAYGHWYYSGLFSLKTQFAPGYKYPDRSNVISDFLSPMYFTLALGADYKPNAHFSLLMAPLTGRLIYVGNQELAQVGAFGVKPGMHSKWELGGLIRAAYSNSYYGDRLGVQAKLELFSNYLNKPQNIDVAFDLTLDYKLMDFLTAKFQVGMLYDDDQRIKQPSGAMIPKLQVRQMFGVGLAYRF